MSVLNVFKTSVDTINASSITSDMTIGANLNGGSLTLGAAGATTNINSNITNIPSGTINASIFKLYSGVIDGKQSIWLDTIESNLTPNMHIGFNNASQIFIGSSKTNTIGIGGDAGTVNIAASGLSGTVNIANSGLSATGRVRIASANTNAAGSQAIVGSPSLSQLYLQGFEVNINDQTGSIASPTYINMGNSTSGATTIRGSVNIGNDGLPAGGRVNIASGTNAANTEMYLGSNSLTKCYLRASDVNINHQTGFNTYVGADNTSITTILGAVNIGSKSSGTSGITKLLSKQTTIAGTNNWPFSVCSVTALNETLRDGIAIFASQNGMAFVVFINSEGAVCGSIGNNGSGSGVLYSTTSDRRLKTNIKPMNNMLDNIMKMKPSNYNWVSNPEVESQGFIAQEIFEIFPEMRIKGFNSDDNIDEPCDENGNPNYYSLDYGKFTPYIIKAMQEMKQDYDKQLQDMKLNYEKRLSNIEELLNIT